MADQGARKLKTCACGNAMKHSAKTCIECREKAPGRSDEFTAAVEQAWRENENTGIAMRELARLLAENHPLMRGKLTPLQITYRLSRAQAKMKAERLRKSMEPRDHAVIGSSPVLLDGAELWRKVEERSLQYHAENDVKNRRVIGFANTSLPVAITFVSDQHIGAEGTLHKRMREDAELVARTEGLYAIFGGDAYDNHIRHLSAMVNSPSTPNDQAKMFLFYLSMFRHKILAAVSGNHEAWTRAFSGIDVLGKLYEQHAILYHPINFYLTILVGNQRYKIFIRHKGLMNSMMNPTHTIKQMWRFGETDFDIGFRGHNHVAAIEPFMGHQTQRWAVRGGTYKEIDDYGEFEGYNRGTPYCPTFILYPDTRRIDGYDDLRKAVTPLAAARAEYMKRAEQEARPPAKRLTKAKASK